MEKGSQGNIPILLLAAGSSSRMGQSKQLLPINDKLLLQKTTETCLLAKTGRVIVILGANEKEHREKIEEYPVDVVVNHNWNKGMGSSIKAGLVHMHKFFTKSEAIIISVCDQPFLEAKHITRLTQEFYKHNANIVASSYKEAFGVPALFGRSLFTKLSQINDAEGAKKIIQLHNEPIVSVPFPMGAIDLDTMEDYNTFNQQ